MWAVRKAIEHWSSLWKKEFEHGEGGLESSQVTGNVPRDDGLVADATDSEEEATILELAPPSMCPIMKAFQDKYSVLVMVPVHFYDWCATTHATFDDFDDFHNLRRAPISFDDWRRVYRFTSTSLTNTQHINRFSLLYT